MTGYNGPFVADDDEARALMSLVTGADVPAEPAGEGKTMGPGQGVNRSAASMDAALAADEASLLAAREAFAGKWDIIEVFGGYLAVPDGTPIIQSTTLGGLTRKLRRLPGSEDAR